MFELSQYNNQKSRVRALQVFKIHTVESLEKEPLLTVAPPHGMLGKARNNITCCYSTKRHAGYRCPLPGPGAWSWGPASPGGCRTRPACARTARRPAGCGSFRSSTALGDLSARRPGNPVGGPALRLSRTVHTLTAAYASAPGSRSRETRRLARAAPVPRAECVHVCVNACEGGGRIEANRHLFSGR